MSSLPQHIEVTMASAYVPISADYLGDVAALQRVMEDVLRGEAQPRDESLPSEPMPPAYDLLLAATDGLVRSVVELHGPEAYKRGDGSVAWWQCEGCEFGGYDGEPPHWPCQTTELIAARIGVDMHLEQPNSDTPTTPDPA